MLLATRRAHTVYFVQQYAGILVDPYGRRYAARVYGACRPGDLWDGWFVFFPLDGGRTLATDRETTQSTLAAVRYWASGITTVDLNGLSSGPARCCLKCGWPAAERSPNRKRSWRGSKRLPTRKRLTRRGSRRWTPTVAGVKRRSCCSPKGRPLPARVLDCTIGPRRRPGRRQRGEAAPARIHASAASEQASGVEAAAAR
jgi:hypothetical protein